MDSVINVFPVDPVDIKTEKNFEIKIEKESEDEVQCKMDCSDSFIKEEIDIGPEEFQQTVHNTNGSEAKMFNIPGSKCRLCNETINVVAVQEEANDLETMCASIQSMGDGLFVSFADEPLILHRDCLKYYTDPNWVKTEASAFNFGTKCVFCNIDASEAFICSQKRKRHWERATVATIKRETSKINVIIKCIHRGDEWSREVLQRIRNINLETVNARYHQKCYASFFDSKVLGQRKRGRPSLDEIEEQMYYVYNYIENDVESQHTLEEIRYNLHITVSDKTVKKKLQQKYGRDISFTQGRGGYWILNFVPGRKLQNIWHEPLYTGTRKRRQTTLDEIEEQMSCIYTYIENYQNSQHTLEEISLNLKITLNNTTVKEKLQEKYGKDVIFTLGRDGQWILNFVPGEKLQNTLHEPVNTDECIQKVHIIQSAANLIRDDIRTKVYANYLAPNSFLTTIHSDIPESLQLFLDSLIDCTDIKPKSKKKAAIAHSIIKAVRPCSYRSPLLLGLGSLLHHKYASSYLIDLLSSLGYSAAYNEILIFESSAPYQSGFMQFAFDNADQTLQDSKMFHVMEGIEDIKPKVHPNQGRVSGDRYESITRRYSI